MENNLNPVDGFGFPTGVIGSVALLGDAVSVSIESDLDSFDGQTAFVATGNYGLAIVNVSDFSNPVVLSELRLDGEIQSVAADMGIQLAFVSAGSGGVHVIDISDPVEPIQLHSIFVPGEVKDTLFFEGLILVAGKYLTLVNPITREIVSRSEVSGQFVDISVENEGIFAILDNSTLVSFAMEGEELIELGRVSIPVPSVRRAPFEDFKVFVDGGVAYVSNGLDLTSVSVSRTDERGGYQTFDVSDPYNMSLLGGLDEVALFNVQSANNETLTNGSGLAVSAAGRFGLEISNASDPSVTFDKQRFLIDTPGDAHGVALAGGLAYVADGPGGLQVVNFLPFDPYGIPPEIQFDASALDINSQIEGIQVEAGSRVRLDFDLFDDISPDTTQSGQVRNVELILDGEVIIKDLASPYDLSFVVPQPKGGKTTLELEIRATDTGGNSTTTPSVTFDIVPDMTAPEVRTIKPADGGLVLIGNQSISVTFSEEMDPESLFLNDIILTKLSTNSQLTAKDISYLDDGRVVRYSFDEFEVDSYQISLDLSRATDRAGNDVGQAEISQIFDVDNFTAIWTVPTGGIWDIEENWETGFLPDMEDGVLIELEAGGKVEIPAGNFEVERVKQTGGEMLIRGALTLSELDLSGAELKIEEGEINDAVIKSASSGEFIDFGNSVFSNVTLDVDGVISSPTAISALPTSKTVTFASDSECLTSAPMGPNRFVC